MPERSLLDWLERLSRALDSVQVPHAVAGGLALGVWATPRATIDIDLAIAAGEDHLEATRRACSRAGLLQTRRQVAPLRRVGLLRMIAVDEGRPEPIAVDLLIVPDPLGTPLFERIKRLPLGATNVPVVSPEDLVLMKLFRASEQDIVDIRAIAATRDLDRQYLSRQAKALRLLTRLRRALPSR